jgi:transposase
MSGYSVDLRQRIVSAVEGGMSKAQAARTFSVSLSSVKRYVEKAERGGSLTPGKSPGAAPKLDKKARKLLEDLKERPYRTLQERRDYVEAVSGTSVSRSTICRAIAKIGPTRKRGAGSHRTRRVRASGLEGDGGRDGETGEARLRGQVRNPYLPWAYLRLRTKRPAITAFGTVQAGQEHDLTFEHECGGDGTISDGGGSDHRCSLRGLRKPG